MAEATISKIELFKAAAEHIGQAAFYANDATLQSAGDFIEDSPTAEQRLAALALDEGPEDHQSKMSKVRDDLRAEANTIKTQFEIQPFVPVSEINSMNERLRDAARIFKDFELNLKTIATPNAQQAIDSYVTGAQESLENAIESLNRTMEDLSVTVG